MRRSRIYRLSTGCWPGDLPESGYRIRAQLRWANLFCSIGQYPQSEAIARQALALAENTGDPLAKCQATLAIGVALHGGGHDRQAIPYLQAAIPLLRAYGDRQAEVKAWQNLAIIYGDSSQYDLAFEAAMASTEINRLVDDRPALARDLITTGWILLEQDDIEHAEPYCQEALRISRALGKRIDEAFALDILANLLCERGSLGPALEMYNQALDICHALHEEKLRLSILLESADLIVRLLGDFEQAERILGEAQTLARNHQLTRELAICSGQRARIDFCRGDLRAARSKLNQSIPRLQERNAPKEVIELRLLQVEIELVAGRPAAALSFLKEAENLSQDLGVRTFQLDLLAARSAVLLAGGRPEEALRISTQAVNGLGSGRTAHSPLLFRHFQALAACGRTVEARQTLQASVRGVDSLIASLSPQQQKTSLERTPIHREILLAWENLHPRQVCISLPQSHNGRTGATPTRQEIQILWTVWLPEDGDIPDKVERRRRQLLRLLNEARIQGASPKYRHLAQSLGVSIRTIAEDVAALSREQSRT